MEAPNRRTLVEQIHSQFPHLLRMNTLETCAEFVQRFLAAAGQEWGFTAKQGGENGYTFPNGVKVSHDAVTWKPWGAPQNERRQIDIINGAGAGHDTPPKPGGPNWQPVPPAVYRPLNIWLDSGSFPQLAIRDDGGTVAGLTLSFSWFPFFRALRDFPEFAENFEFFKQPEHRVDSFRVMPNVEGSRWARNGVDPWETIGMRWDWSDWSDMVRRGLNLLGENGFRARICLYGSPLPATEGDCQRYHDKFVRTLDGLWAVVEDLETANEPIVNGWDVGMLKFCGLDLRSKIPAGTLLAHGSPHLAHNANGDRTTNEEMQDNFNLTYGDPDHAGANYITVHTARDDSRWRDPASFNLFSSLPMKNGEPIGPGASVNTTGDPAILKRDMQRTKDAGWANYTGHSHWGFTNGRLPEVYPDGSRLAKDIENIDAILHGWKEVRGTSTGPVPSPVPSPTPPPTPGASGSDRLIVGQSLLPGMSLISPNGKHSLQYQSDGNLVIYEDGVGPIWASQTAGSTPGSLQMQPDGNLVLYSATDPIWASQTGGQGGTGVQLQDDANLVMYKDGIPIWASGRN